MSTDVFKEEIEEEYYQMLDAIELLLPHLDISDLVSKAKWQDTLEGLAEQNQWSLEHPTGILAGKFFILVEDYRTGSENPIVIQNKEGMNELNIH